MPEIFDNNPNANVELNKYFPQSFSFIESLNNLINYVKSLPIEPTAEILNKIEALENEFLTVKQASEDATADVAELTGKYVSLLQQVTTLAVNVSGFNEKTESIEGELQGIQGNITAIKNKNTEQDNQIAGINQEITGINEDITHNDEAIINLENKYNEINPLITNALRKKDSATKDANDYVGLGIYNIGNTDNSWINMPSGIQHGILLVIENYRIFQFILSNNGMYFRYKGSPSASFGGWNKVTATVI